MNKIILIFIIFLSLPAFAQDSRWIDLEWDSIPEAKFYELELFENEENEKFSRGTFKTSEAKWSHTVTPGKYSLRIRSIDDRGVPGEWSEAIELKVKITSPLQTRPPKDEKVIDSLVWFEWNPVSGAKSYQLVIRDSKKAIIHNSSVTPTKESVYLKELGSYSWTVVALDDGDELKDDNEIPEKSFREFTRVGGELDSPVVKVTLEEMVTLEWDKISDSENFEIDFFPPNGKGEKNRRFNVKETQFIFPKARLKDGTTTITVKATAPGYQDSSKSLVKIIKKNDSVKIVDNITGRSASLKTPLARLFFRNQFFYSLNYSRFNYVSDNQQTDTKLNQSDLMGPGLSVEWLFQNRPQNNAHKFETSALRLTSGGEVGFQTRVAYNYILPVVTDSKSWTFGLGVSYLGIPSFFGNRIEDSVTSEQTSSIGPEVSLGIVDPLTASWHLHANLTYAYHPIMLSSTEAIPDPFSWLRAQLRFLKYTSTRTAFFFGAEYQRCNQTFEENESSLSGWSGVLGLKQGW